MKSQNILLHFGAVDWRAEVYVNSKIGMHEGGFGRFAFFDITSAVKERKSTT